MLVGKSPTPPEGCEIGGIDVVVCFRPEAGLTE
jgi:hypothetical protein